MLKNVIKRFFPDLEKIKEEKVLKNIIDEKVFGNNGKMINSTYITSTGGDGFLLIHNHVRIA